MILTMEKFYIANITWILKNPFVTLIGTSKVVFYQDLASKEHLRRLSQVDLKYSIIHLFLERMKKN